MDNEKVYLGCILNDFEGDLFGITEDNFYQSINKEIFKSIQVLISENAPINMVTVRQKLPDADITYLLDVVNSSYSSNGLEYYAGLLKNKTKKVELNKIASKIMLYANEADKINGEVYDFANELLALNTMSEDHYNIDDDIYGLVNYLDERKGKDLFGFSWGDNFEFLDRYTKGIQKGRTYRIGAPSNLGKSQMMYGVINNLLAQGAKVAFFTLENERSFSFTNILANHQGVNSYKIEDGTESADIDYIKQQEGKLYIVDSCYELGEIFTKVMELKPDVVILDYIGLVQVKKTKEDDKYTEYSKQVQEFVKRSRVSWIDLSNLPKNAEDEDGIRANGGYYGSSFLKNNTDVGIHLTYYKKFYEFKKNALMGDDELSAVFSGIDESKRDALRNSQVAHMIITKNRIGTAKVEAIYKIDFNKGGRFIEATQQELSNWI